MSISISALTIYPIKSCGGIALQRSPIGMAGLHNDRRWMVVDEAGVFLTQRSHPAMARVRTEIRDGYLIVTTPGQPRLDIPMEVVEDDDSVRCQVKVWRDTVDAVDEGDLAAQWFGALLGTPCRLVKVHPQSQRLASTERITGWLARHPEVQGFGIEHVYAFADGYPILVASEASLADLNQRLAARGQPAVGMERFRPNVVLGEFGAFDEDFTVQIRVGEIGMALVKPCVRCPIPNTDQTTGERGTEPVSTLAQFRRQAGGGVTFGMNAIVSAPPGAVIQVGDRAEVVLSI
jgi:hypothetical protein